MRAFLAILVISCAVLLTGAAAIPITVAEQDRVSHIRSQDEATYSRVALEMLFTNDWLTPHILGRLFLQKPPLLYWLAGLSAKLFGVSRLALRLPCVLAGALAIAFVSNWCARVGTGTLTGALLLWTDAPWRTMSRLVMMDALVAACILIALWFVLRDPRLERWTSILGFGAFTAAAILTKSAAGLIPVLVLLLFGLLTGSKRWRGILLALTVAACLAAPWHVYQAATHPAWFTTEYIGNQLFGFGMHPPAQPSTESQWWFYARRLFLNDPVLALASVFGLPLLAASVRRQDASGLLLASWIAVVLGAMFAFQSRSFLYAILLILPLAILAAGYAMLPARWMIGILLIACAIKIAVPGYWSPAFSSEDRTGAPLRDYAARLRPNELILVAPDDEFFSMLLPIPGVRYVFLETTGALRRYAPHLADLGITMTATEFVDYARVEPRYLARLRAWTLNNPDPLATAISAASPSDIAAVVRSRPDSDFYLPAEWASDNTHLTEDAGHGRVFLLARHAPSRERPRLLPPGFENKL